MKFIEEIEIQSGRRLIRPFFVRYSGFRQKYKECNGKIRNGMCIFSIGDLFHLANLKNYFFVNKFLLDYDPITYQCMEELYFDRAKNQRQIIDMKEYCAVLKKFSLKKC